MLSNPDIRADPMGPPVRITCFLDADHADYQMTRWSYSGILVDIIHALISWYRQRYNTIEDFSFRSEIICGSIAFKKVKALTYKLRMFRKRVEGPANMYVENELMVKCVTMPESTLKKNHMSICYNGILEAVPMERCELSGCQLVEILPTFLLSSWKVQRSVKSSERFFMNSCFYFCTTNSLLEFSSPRGMYKYGHCHPDSGSCWKKFSLF